MSGHAIRVAYLVLATLAGCAPTQTVSLENRFSLIDQNKYKDERQKSLGWQLAVNDCKSKAMTASSAVEKSVASEHHGLENLQRAREKAEQMYETSFTTCMNNYGYIKN
jgi:hypothetical protein